MAERVPLEPIPGRKTPTKGVKISLGEPTILFLTVCTKDRAPWLAQKAVQKSLEETWGNADAWLVGDYLLMPDHLHLFCAARDLQFWKREITRAHSNKKWEWQRNSFHHRLRKPREYQEKLQYVLENPVRKGLVKSIGDWPYSGRVHQLPW